MGNRTQLSTYLLPQNGTVSYSPWTCPPSGRETGPKLNHTLKPEPKSETGSGAGDGRFILPDAPNGGHVPQLISPRCWRREYPACIGLRWVSYTILESEERKRAVVAGTPSEAAGLFWVAEEAWRYLCPLSQAELLLAPPLNTPPSRSWSYSQEGQ